MKNLRTHLHHINADSSEEIRFNNAPFVFECYHVDCSLTVHNHNAMTLLIVSI